MGTKKVLGFAFLLLGIILLLPAEILARWETGAKVGFDSNVNRAIEGAESDTYLGAHLSFLKEASGESRFDWTFLATAEGAAFARINNLSYVSLTLAPGLTFFPHLSWTINISPFILGSAVKDSDQSALAFGAKVSVRQQPWKNIYTGQYYAYTDSRANLDTYSFTENALGVFLGVNWVKAFSSEIGYEYSHGDSFRSLPATGATATTPGAGRGRGKPFIFSSTFGDDVFREKVDRHSFGVTAAIELTRSIFSQIFYTYTPMNGDLGTSVDHQGLISLVYRF